MQIALLSTQHTLYAALKTALGANFEIYQIQDQYSVEEFLSGDGFDIAILDLNSAIGSLDSRKELARTYIAAGVALILLADDTMRSCATELVKEGAYGYCRAPLHIAELKAMLRRANETSQLKRELRATKRRLESNLACDQMIGSSPQMRHVYSLIHRVASFDNNVLVTGESGTGKELIARALHNLGDRAGRPFVAVSCGAIPETLIESELFGHEKGAFTGSNGTRAGLLEQAADGTVFLDEIGELSLFTQVKLLRVLQQKEFMRLGGTRLVPLRARIIFATHRDLDEMVVRGQFRQDLYYRINVVKIEAPPLRERAEDIPRIALHFLMQYSQAYQKEMQEIDSAAMSQLMTYSWPGNVRELENVIQRAVLLSMGNRLTVEDLPDHLREEAGVELAIDQLSGSFERQLRDYKVKLAAAAVRENNGNKTLAARSLNISRAYLHRLIRLADSNDHDPMEEQEPTSSITIM
ncbi:MAG: sigma 54-interacting transcriptional regulator [Acidobacteriota bacterium]